MGSSTTVLGAMHINAPIPADEIVLDTFGAHPAPVLGLTLFSDPDHFHLLRLRLTPDGRADAAVPLIGVGEELCDYYKMDDVVDYDVELLAKRWPTHSFTGYVEAWKERESPSRLGILSGGRVVRVTRRDNWSWPDLETEGRLVAGSAPIHAGKWEYSYGDFFSSCVKRGEEAALDWFRTHRRDVPPAAIQLFRERWAESPSSRETGR